MSSGADLRAERGAASATSVEIYRRSADVEQQAFEDDLLLLHGGNRVVLGLNEGAATLWEALRWPQSVDDLAALLVAAWPDRSREWARSEVVRTLAPLVEHGFLVRVEPDLR